MEGTVSTWGSDKVSTEVSFPQGLRSRPCGRENNLGSLKHEVVVVELAGNQSLRACQKSLLIS